MALSLLRRKSVCPPSPSEEEGTSPIKNGGRIKIFIIVIVLT